MGLFDLEVPKNNLIMGLLPPSHFITKSLFTTSVLNKPNSCMSSQSHSSRDRDASPERPLIEISSSEEFEAPQERPVAPRQVCYTLNNYTDDDIYRLQSLHLHSARGGHGIVYHCFQTEKGEKETPHIQGFICFNTAKKRAAVLNVLNAKGERRVHIEFAKGTPEQNRAYCFKKESFDRAKGIRFEIGVLPQARPGQGKRTDLRKIQEELDQGVPVHVVAKDPESFGTCLKYWSSMIKYSSANLPPRDFHTRFVYIWGDSGCGKSTTARAYPDYYEPPKPQGPLGKLWFENYDPVKHRTLILNDWGASNIPLNCILNLADSGPMIVEVKGGSCQFRSELLVWTANYSPYDIYDFKNPEKKLQFHWPAFERRIDVIFRHYRSEAPDTEGQVIVAVQKGDIRFHPFRKHMTPLRVNMDGHQEYIFHNPDLGLDDRALTRDSALSRLVPEDPVLDNETQDEEGQPLIEVPEVNWIPEA